MQEYYGGSRGGAQTCSLATEAVVMSFLPAVRHKVDALPQRDRTRVALQYLLNIAVGRMNAVPLSMLVADLRRRRIDITETGFQQTILAESRHSDYFIGSSRHGYFLIDTIDDARAMRDFYERRIAAEQQNLDNLRRQARNVGWRL
jgi:hypothetical protein